MSSVFPVVSIVLYVLLLIDVLRFPKWVWVEAAESKRWWWIVAGFFCTPLVFVLWLISDSRGDLRRHYRNNRERGPNKLAPPWV